MNWKYSFSFIFLFVFVACEKDPFPVPEPEMPTMTLKMNSVYGQENLFLDSIYETPEGYQLKFTDIKCIFGAWKNGSTVLFDAALFDFREKGSTFFSAEGNYENFPSLDGFLGLEAAVNHADPTAFPNNHPLNIVNVGGMHWGWNPGYIFIKVEGRVDTIPDQIQNFDHTFMFHSGTDSYLQTVSFDAVPWQVSGANHAVATLKLDMYQFLFNTTQPINLKTESVTHSAPGQEVLTLKSIQNFKNAMQFVP